MKLVVGVFVGGKGTRMGGVAKGELRLTTGQTLLDRLLAQCRAALPGTRIVLVGESASRSELALPRVEDAVRGIGPLGGLSALLQHAAEMRADAVLVLANDLPFVSARLLERIAREAPEAEALAPRRDGLWYPLTARYRVSVAEVVGAAIDTGEHSLQRLFARLGTRARELELSAAEFRELRDWDRPEDLLEEP
jgi:molybdopterin-guanine dinucleotide biosynthesis protein A